MKPPRRKRFKKHNYDPEKCELPGSESDGFNTFKTESKISRQADKKASKPTHYVCIPLAKLIPQYDTIAEEVTDFYKNEEKPPSFSTSTRDRLHLTLLMISPKTKDEETKVELVLKEVCDNFETKLTAEIETKKRQQQELQNTILKNPDKNFLLELDSLGAFHQGHLIYSTCSQTPFWLTYFRKTIHDELSSNGIIVEDINERPYIPHVTMFRHKQSSGDCFVSEALLEHLDGFGLGNIFVDAIDFLRIGGDTRVSFKIEPEVERKHEFDEPLATSFIRKYLRYARIVRRYCGL